MKLTEIMKAVSSSSPKKVSASLLWDQDMDSFDWQKSKVLVAQRVIERGRPDDFLAAFELYGGEENFREIVKEVPYLSGMDVNFVCVFFDLKKEELRCCTRKLYRERLLGC